MGSYDLTQPSSEALRWTLENLVPTQAFSLRKVDDNFVDPLLIYEDNVSGWGSKHAEGWDGADDEAISHPDLLLCHVVSDEFSFQAITSTGHNVHSESRSEGRRGQFETTVLDYARRLMKTIKKKCLESIQKVFQAYQRQSNVTFELLMCPHFSSPSSAATTGEIIIREGEKHHARLLIIASHGPIGEMAHIGSISRHVWHHSKSIPVLLIPPHAPPSESGKNSAVVAQPDVVVILEDEDQLRECSQFIAECLVRVGDSVHVWFCGPANKQPVPQSVALDIETSILAQSSCEGVYVRGFSSSSSLSPSVLQSPLGLFAIYDVEDETSSKSSETTSDDMTLPETISSLLEFYSTIRLVAVFDPCGGGESRSIKCELTRGEMVRHLAKNCSKPLVMIPPSKPKPPMREVKADREEDELMDPLSSGNESEEENSRNY